MENTEDTGKKEIVENVEDTDTKDIGKEKDTEDTDTKDTDTKDIGKEKIVKDTGNRSWFMQIRSNKIVLVLILIIIGGGTFLTVKMRGLEENVSVLKQDLHYSTVSVNVYKKQIQNLEKINNNLQTKLNKSCWEKIKGWFSSDESSDETSNNSRSKPEVKEDTESQVSLWNRFKNVFGIEKKSEDLKDLKDQTITI